MDVREHSTEEYEFLREALVSTFSTPSGRIVFDWLLTSLGFFSEAESEEGRIRRNFATKLLESMGAFHVYNSSVVADFLLKVPKPPLKRKPKEDLIE